MVPAVLAAVVGSRHAASSIIHPSTTSYHTTVIVALATYQIATKRVSVSANTRDKTLDEMTQQAVDA